MNTEQTTIALNEIKELVTKHKELLPNRVLDVVDHIEDHLLRLELGAILGAKIPEYTNPTMGYVDLYGNKTLAHFKDGHRTISWPDDGLQPPDGWYLVISFPTGPYILNSEYPIIAFNGFFEELKSFGADHVDSHNHGLYYSLERSPEAAGQVYAQYREIYEKWWAEGKKEILKEEIAKAEAELNRLKDMA